MKSWKLLQRKACICKLLDQSNPNSSWKYESISFNHWCGFYSYPAFTHILFIDATLNMQNISEHQWKLQAFRHCLWTPGYSDYNVSLFYISCYFRHKHNGGQLHLNSDMANGISHSLFQFDVYLLMSSCWGHSFWCRYKNGKHDYSKLPYNASLIVVAEFCQETFVDDFAKYLHKFFSVDFLLCNWSL